MTGAAEITKEYQRLGGKRLAKIDDNIIRSRKWEDEPEAAAAFWRENIEVLSDKEQAEVVLHLKPITSPDE